MHQMEYWIRERPSVELGELLRPRTRLAMTSRTGGRVRAFAVSVERIAPGAIPNRLSGMSHLYLYFHLCIIGPVFLLICFV